MGNGGRASVAANVVVIGLCALLLAHVAAAVRNAPPDADFQWDFRLYYFSAYADGMGFDAYDEAAVSSVADRDVTLPYCYLPLTLNLWRPLTSLPFETAARLYLGLTVGAALALMLLWRRVFLREGGSPLFYPFCLLAYGATLLTGIASGNAVWLEQLLLWGGLACYVRGRLSAFTILIVLASLLKMTTLAFLVLLMLPATRARLLCLFGGLAAFALTLGGGWWLDPARWAAWVRNVSRLSGERGVYNPALWPAARDVVEQVGLAPDSAAAPVLYAAAALLVVGLSWRAWRMACGDGQEHAVRVVFLVALTLAIISPRFKDYAYVALLAPTWFVLTRMSREVALALLLVATCLPFGASLPITRSLGAFFVDYASLWVAMGAWTAMCASLGATGEGTPSGLVEVAPAET